MQASGLTNPRVPGWSDCMEKSAYAVFMFSENKLFRLAVRFVSNDTECRDQLASSIDTFAKAYGILVSGAGDERRFRYETNQVIAVAKSDGNGVVFEFVQR